MEPSLSIFDLTEPAMRATAPHRTILKWASSVLYLYAIVDVVVVIVVCARGILKLIP